MIGRCTRVLVAGIGNVFQGDDAFGVEVARKLARERFPEGVRVVDFGIRGVHLAYDLLDEPDALVLVDAMSRGESPGTVFVFEPTVAELDTGDPLDAHSLNPAAVLRLATGLGARLGWVRVVGCEPADVTERMGLSAPVAHALGTATRLVRELAMGAVSRTLEASRGDGP